jgi:Fe-S-cluster containining protein
MNRSDDGNEDSQPLEGEGRCGLRQLYEELDREVAQAGPVCALSGRCCRFQEYGHTLFVSTVEVEYLLGGAPAPAGVLDQGATCPWQDSRGHCTARDARPLGCRTYYCDPSFQEESHRLSESYIDRLKSLSTQHGIAWNYAPLHRHLHAAREEGRFPAAEGDLNEEKLARNPS